MHNNKLSKRKKWMYSISIGLLAFILFNNLFYSLSNKVLCSLGIVKPFEIYNLPSLWSTLFISFIFIIILRFLMG